MSINLNAIIGGTTCAIQVVTQTCRQTLVAGLDGLNGLNGLTS